MADMNCSPDSETFSNQRPNDLPRDEILESASSDWRLTFDCIPDPVLLLDNENHIRLANVAAARILGECAVANLIGRHCYEVVHGRTDPHPDCPHQRLLKTGEESSADIHEPRLGRYFHASATPVRGAAGEIHGCVHVLRDITDRKLAETLLKRQEEWLRLLFDSTAEALTGMDVQGRCTFANAAAARILGYDSPDDLLGKDMHALAHYAHEDGSPYTSEDCLIRKAARANKRCHADYEVFWKRNGTSFPAEYWAYPIVEDQQFVGMVVNFRDITERRLAEDALRHSEERYRLLFESNPQPMWVYELGSLRFLAVNQAAVEHYGYSRNEFLNMTLRDVRPSADVSEFESAAKVLLTGPACAGIWRHKTKSGRVIYSEITECIIDFEGVEASLVCANDVTTRVTALDAVKKSEREFRSIIEGAPYGIYRCTYGGKILMANPALAGLLEYASPKEIVGLTTAAALYVDAEERAKLVAHWTGQERISHYEVNWKTQSGKPIKVLLAGRRLPETIDGERVFEVFVQDVTEQRSLEDQFRQAQKMEAVGRLAGGVAHDFNNILGVISGYSDLMIEQTNDAKALKRLREVKKATRRAVELTRQLLAFSRKQVLEPKVLDLNVLVTESTRFLVPLVGEDIQISTHIESALARIKADPTQIEQVIVNLAVNARDAMPEGGILTIETANVTIDGHSTGHHRVSPGDYVLLAVSDTGSGIPDDVLPRIFEPFFTTKEKDKGTGLGLSTVYGIVKQSSGYIWVYSETGKGTSFKIYLPVVRDGALAGPPLEPESESPGGTETILLVEDADGLRELGEELLQTMGYTVLTARDPAEALSLAAQHRGPIHLLLTDVVMPIMNGRELAEHLESSRPQMKVIYMSGYTDNAIVHQAVLDERIVFLQKPISKQALAARIRSVLDPAAPSALSRRDFRKGGALHE